MIFFLQIMAWTLLTFVACSGLFVCSAATQLTLGLITPPDGKLGFERVAAASTMAIEQAQKDGFLSNVDVRIIWRNGNCDGKEALGRVVTLWEQENIDGFIGLPCSIASINAGKIIAYWNLPHLSYSSVDPVLADKVMYNTLVRLMSPYNRMADALVELFRYHEWNRVVLATMPDPDNLSDDNCEFAGRAFANTFKDVNISVGAWLEEEVRMTADKMRSWLTRIKLTSRIVVICAMNKDIRDFMLAAQDMGMTSGDYVFIAVNLLPVENLERRWFVDGDKDNNRARVAYGTLLQMSEGFITSPEAVEFLEQIPYKMAEPPWNYNRTLETGQTGTPYALFLYDCVYLYAMVAEEMYRMGTTPRNGSLMYSLAKQKVFKGKSGVVRLDPNGDRIGDYRVWHLTTTSPVYESLLQIIMTDTSGDKVKIEHQRNWGPSGMLPPSDSPVCGFYDELCKDDTSGRDATIIGVVVVCLVLIGGLTAAIFIYRKKKFEQDLALMLWKVRYDDLDFVKNKLTSNSVASSISSTGSGPLVGDIAEGKIQLAHYRGMLVTVKKLQKTGIVLTREDHLELKQMKDINHENLNMFVGVCVDPPYICIIYRYCAKGSLQDILMNDDIKLDHNFRLSLLTDLIHGLEHLHRVTKGNHGNLKSSNCVIDGRWVLKVTDWGLYTFREQLYETENEKYSAMLWTAPEILRDPTCRGSQKGDVYSFAIILQELLYRALPYQINGDLPMVPKDLVGRIRNGETPPYRPQLPDNKEASTTLVQLMIDCWKEDCSERPDFPTIKARFSAINKGKRYNIMDNMLRMMEKYATNLEELVGERTRQLVEEKKKTDMLLYRMLPSAVADALKVGKTIKPEAYSEVSVYFSDIVSFTTMASTSTPMEVIDFLNDLWTLFDDILSKYDVYKVETIGDAYMVASGLPLPNPKHAAEIGNMALDILSSVMTFKIRHRPQDQLKVRIGIHSGPCVAGIVGQTMPRYCLFGDTVNTASRMESSGEALRIHLSEHANNALVKVKGRFIISKRGVIDVKGKGSQTTYWLDGKEGYTRPLPRYTD